VLARLLALLLLAFSASGCVAAAALPAVGMTMMSDAAGSVAKAGVEHTMGGAAYRTFSAPLDDVRMAVLQSFRELEIDITEDAPIVGGGAQIVGQALHRQITVKLEPVTPALTRLKMVVRKGVLGRDRSTSSELIEQTARALNDLRPVGGASPRAP
jgi:hypothetical protein